MAKNLKSLKTLVVKSNIFNPLQKVRVVSSKRKPWKTNSIGYVAYSRPSSEDFKQGLIISFMRHGKSGKPRCTIDYATHDIISMSDLGEQDRISLCHGIGNRREYINTWLEPLAVNSKSILKFSTLDFIGYISALSAYIVTLQEEIRQTDLHRQIRNKYAGVPTILTNLSTGYASQILGNIENKEINVIDVTRLAAVFHVLSSIGKPRNAAGNISPFDRLLNYFNTPANRTPYLEKLHISLCCLKNVVKDYHRDTMASSIGAEKSGKDYILHYRKKIG